jgi:hypothetical protein
MVRRQIDFDEETDRNLANLAEDYGGNLNEALADLLRSRESIESFLDSCEEAQRDSIQQQLRRSEREFASGATVPWTELKRRNGL